MLMKYRSALVIPLLMASWTVVFAHTDKREKKTGRQSVERSVAADPNVMLSLCLMSGSVKVHGWDRNEVRARSSDAADIELRRTGNPNDSDPARKLTLLVADTARRQAGQCLSDSDIELEVPRGAIVHFQTRDGDITVADIAKLYAHTQTGNVHVERMSRVIEASSIGGNISLRNSKGSIRVHSVSGNIEARSVGPSEAGDIFEANTVAGDIVLDRAGHVRLSATTVSGCLSISGPLARGARYSFQTISGDLTLTLPADSSFRLSATISRNAEITTDFSLTLTGPAHPSPSDKPGKPAKKEVTVEGTDLLKGRDYGLQRIDAIYGSGDASISLSSFGGTVHLRKK